MEPANPDPWNQPPAPDVPRPARFAPPPPPENAGALDLLLRRPDVLFERLDGPRGEALVTQLVLLALAGHLVFGLVVGSFSGGVQWWASPLKSVTAMVVTGLICFPSLYILVSFTGAVVRARHVLAMLFGLLALTGVFLAGFAPVAWVFSQSSTLVSFVGALFLLIWVVSLLVSQRVLSAGLRVWHARTTGIVGFWLFVFLVTSLQMLTALRPIVGTSPHLVTGERRFFLAHWAETMQEDGRRP